MLYKEQSPARRLFDDIVVRKTASQAFVYLAEAVADLSKVMGRQERFDRLLEAFHSSFPCDAIALLKREGPVLVPLAVRGLSPDTLGRRFVIAEQPRLAQILHSPSPVRFPANTALPDPYDGLVDKDGDHTHVHDCMGVALHIDGEPWGVVTLDALIPGGFTTIDPDMFHAFAAVAAGAARAADRIRQLEEEIDRHHRIHLSSVRETTADELIGDSAAMEQLGREVHTVAPSDLPVLILGETGVGKEMVAKLIHRYSTRAHEPIVYVNCAALPEALAESELFGHVQGAFSGAIDDRVGKFELAHEGTIFLDEVGELPPAVQAKLLRVLQNGEIQRIGSDAQHRVDARVLAATNRNLKNEITAGRFRADLYHRLSVYPLMVPPLRERGDDILLLAGYFIERNQRRLGLRRARLSPGARQWLADYAWPGNVRELEHTLSRAMIRAVSESASHHRVIEILPHHLGTWINPLPTATSAPAARSRPAAPEADDRTLGELMETYQREILQARLEAHDGNASATARSLGVDRGNFHRLLKRLGLR